MTTNAIIYVVDDDRSIGFALATLLRTEGHMTRTFTTATAFLADYDPEVPGCLVTDLLMPGMSGLELQTALATRDYLLPIVFFTGQVDVKVSVQAMKAGAVDFLCKPVQPEELFTAVREALARDEKLRTKRVQQRRVRALIDNLTPQEKVVLGLVVSGLPNKVIAGRLGRAERTIKLHKQAVMGKMGVRSATALLHLLVDADMAPPHGSRSHSNFASESTASFAA